MAAGWDISAVQVALRAWAEAQTGITFVAAGAQGSAPAYPYGTFQILSGPVSGNRASLVLDYDEAEDELTYEARNIGVMTVRFQTFSFSQAADASARTYLEQLIGSIPLPSTQDTLGAVGLDPHEAPGVSDLSDVFGKQSRSRAQVDVLFNVGTSVSESVSWIDTVQGTGTTTLPNGAENESDYTATAGS